MPVRNSRNLWGLFHAPVDLPRPGVSLRLRLTLGHTGLTSEAPELGYLVGLARECVIISNRPATCWFDSNSVSPFT